MNAHAGWELESSSHNEAGAGRRMDQAAGSRRNNNRCCAAPAWLTASPRWRVVAKQEVVRTGFGGGGTSAGSPLFSPSAAPMLSVSAAAAGSGAPIMSPCDAAQLRSAASEVIPTTCCWSAAAGVAWW